LFTTPEDREPAPVLIRARELGEAPRQPHEAALHALRQDAELCRQHINALPAPPQRRPGDIDIDLATARARIAQAGGFAEAIGYLSRRETLAVLKDAATLQHLLALPA
ncbi:MAG: glucan biosynthesis glucosyltransferase H, partial [Bradyrhizobium sp.]|nr:glucan biosynthesis glucosyltransferase H [Bradyrhizobium sp.]